MTIVFMAPIGNDAASWEWVPAARRGVRHEFPGFGRPRARVQPTMATLADEVAAAYEPPLHLVGVSMGAMVGQNVAVRHPGLVASLLIACTGANTDPAVMEQRAVAAETEGMEAVLDSTMTRWFTATALARRPEPAGVAYARETLLAMDPHCFADGWRAIGTHDIRAALPGLTIPITAAAGSRDASSPLSRSEEIAERAPGARLVVMEGAPHMSHLETPAALDEVIADHLRWAGAPQT